MLNYNTFIPAWTKRQFVNALVNLYPNDRAKFNSMKIRQLKAIWRNL